MSGRILTIDDVPAKTGVQTRLLHIDCAHGRCVLMAGHKVRFLSGPDCAAADNDVPPLYGDRRLVEA
jgi:hypothetical protein